MSLLDARTDDVGEEITAKVCVIGAGAAGITLARSLGQAGIDVLLVESGDFSLEGQTQALYAGKNIGQSYYDLMSCRLRYFGGTTNHWAGFCRANNPINYMARPDLGISGWPFGAEEARPYLDRAAETLEISSDFFQPYELLKQGGVDADDFVDRSQSAFFTAVNQISKQRKLGAIHLDEVTGSPHVRVVTNLNAVDIGLSPDARKISQVTCKTLTGKTVTLRASAFVLACHTIENARLLLASNSVASAGVGNENDLVGRFFMEHPQIDASIMAPGPGFQDFYDRVDLKAKANRVASLTLSEEAMRREGALTYHISFYGAFASAGARRATRRFASALFEPFSPDMLDDARVMLSELDGIAKSAIDNSGIVSVPKRMMMMSVNHMIEQAPNPDSRVTLSADRTDALGMPQVDLNWQLNDLDLHTLQTGQRLAVAELSALGFGRFEVEELDWPLVKERVKGHYHHYGTTRMSEGPSDGVVDGSQKVHGIENLYMAGSSVFPTSTAHGPTLHIIAFSFRLADILQQRVAQMEPPT